MALLMPQSGRRPQHQKQTFRLVLGPLYPRKRILGGDERSCFELKTDIVGWLGVVSSA